MIIFSLHAVHLSFTSSAPPPTPKGFYLAKRPQRSPSSSPNTLPCTLLSIYPPCGRGDAPRARPLSCISILSRCIIAGWRAAALICQLCVTRTSVMVTTDRKVNSNNIHARWRKMTSGGVSVCKCWCSHSVVRCGIHEYIQFHILTHGNYGSFI